MYVYYIQYVYILYSIYIIYIYNIYIYYTVCIYIYISGLAFQWFRKILRDLAKICNVSWKLSTPHHNFILIPD